MEDILIIIGKALISMLIVLNIILILVGTAMHDSRECKEYPETIGSLLVPGIAVGCFVGSVLATPLNVESK